MWIKVYFFSHWLHSKQVTSPIPSVQRHLFHGGGLGGGGGCRDDLRGAGQVGLWRHNGRLLSDEAEVGNFVDVLLREEEVVESLVENFFALNHQGRGVQLWWGYFIKLLQINILLHYLSFELFNTKKNSLTYLHWNIKIIKI